MPHHLYLYRLKTIKIWLRKISERIPDKHFCLVFRELPTLPMVPIMAPKMKEKMMTTLLT